MPDLSRLPRWAVIAAIGGAIIVGYFILRKTGGSALGGAEQPPDQAASQDTSGASGGGSGATGGFPDTFPDVPAAIPLVATEPTGTVDTTTAPGVGATGGATTATIASAAQASQISASMHSLSGIDVSSPFAPYISTPTGTLVLPEVQMPNLPTIKGTVRDTYGQMQSAATQLITTPNTSGAVPQSYGGVLPG